MPMDTWDAVAGKSCEVIIGYGMRSCGNPATHYYGAKLICCQCHDPMGGLFTPEQAQKEHDRVLARRRES